MKTFKVISLFLMAVLLFLPLQSAAAKDASYDGQVVFGQSFTLKSGEVLDGDLLVMGGSAMLEAGSTINGDVVLFGGTLVANGEITGEVAVTGGTVTIGATAHLHMNLTTVGASLERAEGARIDGKVYNTATSWIENGNHADLPVLPVLPDIPETPITPKLDINFRPLTTIFNALAQSVGMAVLAMLVMLFMAPHADRVAHAAMGQPLTAGGLGLLTLVVAPIMLVLLTITIILIPVVALAVVVLVVAAIFGWIAIGYEIGQRFTAAIHQTWHPALTAGPGVFALTLGANILTGVPVLNCIGWLAPFLIGLVGLGAVIMTRFGAQAAVAPQKTPPAAVLPPAAEDGPSEPLPPTS